MIGWLEGLSSLIYKRYRQGKECACMNLNNQQGDAWSPNEMSQYINVKMSIYTPEVRTKWVELQLNGEYIYIWLKRISMTNSKFSWWNGGETETQKLAAEPAIEGIPSRSRIAPFNTDTALPLNTFPGVAYFLNLGWCLVKLPVSLLHPDLVCSLMKWYLTFICFVLQWFLSFTVFEIDPALTPLLQAC